jgi:HAD domain in Swiss Army Knife RNA repair proteins
MNSVKPLLLVDVDGVISLFGFDHSRPPAGRFEIVDGIAHFLSASAGEHLRELSAEFELVWCTGWEEKANEYLPRALGLPAELPHLEFERNPGRANGHWKLAAIDAYAGPDRALAWIDDAHDEDCTSWAKARSAPTLLVATEPAVGLTRAQVAELMEWADASRCSFPGR